MKPKSLMIALALLAGTAVQATMLEAKTLRWARTGDALTFDPYGQNEGPTFALNMQVYEALTERANDGKLLPLLATSWKTLDSDPMVWEIKLRQGVKFHDGAPFSADDVVFSYARAMGPTSDHRGYLQAVDTVTKIDALTIHIKTKGPSPLFIDNTTNVLIMNKAWTEKNNAAKAQDFKAKEENFAVRNAMGTGPYVLVSREPDVKTVLKRNDAYWGKGGAVAMEVSEIIYTPIKQDATRVAALLSGEVDFVQDVPVQDIEKLKSQANIRVTSGPENRSIFFGMDVGSKELKTSDVKGKNPFADKRVRQALNMSLNREAIRRVVMRGESVPAGVIMPSFVNGYTKELDTVPPVDAAAAKKLLADAGYPNGFSVTLHCPNDRYVNDEGICQAAVGMWGQIGVKVNLVSQSKSLHFPMIQKNPPETEFYLLGWGVPTYDSDYIFSNLYHERTGPRGGFNGTRYENKALDEKIRALSSEVNLTKRNAMIAEIWKVLADETVYIAVHHQTLAYAGRGVEVPVNNNNTPPIKYIVYKGS